MPDTIITAQEIVAAYGSYYIDEGQNMQRIRMLPFEQFGTRDAFTNIPTNQTQERYARADVEEVLQAYQDTFTAKGKVEFKPVVIDLDPMKIDQKFNPTKLANTWLGFLTNNNTDRKTWPFIRWIVEEYLLKKNQDDLETKAIYKGEKVAIVEGTATTAGGVMDGIRKRINSKLGDTIIPIPTGALSNDPVGFVDQIEAWVKATPEIFWNKNVTVNMNLTRALLFREGMKKKYNMYYAQESDLSTVSLMPTWKIVGRASQSGSDKIWGTPKENAVLFTKGFNNANGFELESEDRNVKMWSDWWMGFGWLLDDLMFTNELDAA